LNIRENALLLKNISLEAGNITAATLTGEIRKSKGDFYYSAGLKIKRLDLSALNLMSGLKIGGIITSDNLRVRGSMKERSPEVSGIVRLRDGIFRSDTTDIGGVHAEMTFLPGDEISLKSEANARISKVYGYALDKPADTILKLTARGNLNRIDIFC
jgi:hypothetical protein